MKKNGVTYLHSRESGKTIAFLEGVGSNPQRLLEKLVDNNSTMLSYTYQWGDDLKANGEMVSLKDMYKAIAKTNFSEGDTYDETTGERVAHEKVMAKYHANMDKSLRMLLKDARALIGGIEYYMDKHGIDYSNVPSIEEIRAKRFCAPENQGK